MVSLPLALGLGALAVRLGGEALAMRQQFRINNLFARAAARHLGRPDLVHAWSGSAEPSLRAARARGIPTVVERGSSHMLTQCRLLRDGYAALGLRWVETPAATVDRELREYAVADQVFVPSLFVERSFLAEGVAPARIFRNGFGVDTRRFTPGPKSDATFRVVFAGALSVRKGIHHLVHAFREAAIPDSELLLVGQPGAETPRLLGAPDPRIRCVGHVPQAELPALYRTASVFALASLEEGQAMVQAQALACGLPLVCSAHTGGEDFLALSGAPQELGDSRRYRAGLVVPAGDAPAFARALRWLADHPGERAQMAATAAALAERDLSWARYARANLQQYAEIVARAAARREPDPALSPR